MGNIYHDSDDDDTFTFGYKKDDLPSATIKPIKIGEKITQISSTKSNDDPLLIPNTPDDDENSYPYP